MFLISSLVNWLRLSKLNLFMRIIITQVIRFFGTKVSLIVVFVCFAVEASGSISLHPMSTSNRSDKFVAL